MIERQITPTILNEAKEFPVLTLIGPRQSGKTTLVKKIFASYHYANLENPELQELATTDPKTFFKQFPAPLIIDEIQRVPSLLSWIQVNVDEGMPQGSYVLTGSHQLQLKSAISQSLAGRTTILTLLPLSIQEIVNHQGAMEKEEQLLKGFLPRIYSEHNSPLSTYRNYFATYVERDVRLLINIKHTIQFEQFMKLLAGRIGQIINLSSLSNDLGVSSTTLNEWLSILEASFIVFRLPPYYNNFGKRLVKSPKLYFTEPGLVTWLLGIETQEQLLRDPLQGNLFENMIVLEALKTRYNKGKESNLYFWRDNNGNEIDLILDNQRQLTPVEIKSSRTWNSQFAKQILNFQRVINTSKKGKIIYSGEHYLSFDSYEAVPFTQALDI